MNAIFYIPCFYIPNDQKHDYESNGVNAMGFRVSFFCLIVVNGHQLFAHLRWKLILSLLQGMHG